MFCSRWKERRKKRIEEDSVFTMNTSSATYIAQSMRYIRGLHIASFRFILVRRSREVEWIIAIYEKPTNTRIYYTSRLSSKTDKGRYQPYGDGLFVYV